MRGTKQKLKQREYRHKKLLEENKIKEAERLRKIIDKNSITKPNLTHINPELDSRFIQIDLENNTCFDGWITISSIGNREKIQIPFKKHKHFNKMLTKGKLKKGIRLNKNSVDLMFDIEKKRTKIKKL